MWIDRKAYEDSRLELATAKEEARVLFEQNRAMRSTLEWFMVRVTQIEKERAILTEHYMGIKLETPDFRRGAPVAEVPQNIPDMLGSMGFNDMGDEAAHRLGLDWDAAGKVVTVK